MVKVSATDSDLGENSVVTFSLAASELNLRTWKI